jgi:putative selenate reductase molybdopterin-binding subunit
MVHDKHTDSFIREPQRNILLDLHGHVGDVEAGFAAADHIHEATYFSPRIQHVHLETHCSVSWIDEDERLVVRTSSQSPSVAKQKLSYLFDLQPDALRVFCERVGGAFGGKQDVLTEDIVALATLDTGQPVSLEFTREEEFIGGVTRHPMHITVKLGALADGTLTAMQARTVANTGAYGNHGGEVLWAATGAPYAIYKCPNKKLDAFSVYTNCVPAGAVRGYGATQPTFAVESALDELARRIGMSPLEIRRKNMVRPGDPLVGLECAPSDVAFGSYGLDQCLDAVETALARGDGAEPPPGADWLVGQGIAMSLHETAPPTEHRSEATLCLAADGRYDLSVVTVEFGEGTTTSHVQMVAHQLGTTPARVRITQADTDATGFDTGAFASAGLVVSGKAVLNAANALRDRILDFAAACAGAAVTGCRLDDEAVECAGTRIQLDQLHVAAVERGILLADSRQAHGTPRSVAFDVQGFRVAVNRVTGALQILHSVHAADAGNIINPSQVRGQIEGGVAQGIGFALTERLLLDDHGRVVNPNLRNYRIPGFADVPPTDVFTADTYDSIGPVGAKGIAESNINAVAPALANAIEDATGVRFRELPFTPDRLFQRLVEAHPVPLP